jgi:AmmeMemoRadiSam system protein B
VGRRLADYLERSGLAAVLVASTDLTHYGPAYGFEPKGRGPAALGWVTGENDPAWIEAVASGDGERMLRTAAQRHNACSAGAVVALNEVARRQGARFEPLDYATSADVKPSDALNFVGYVGGVFR